MEDCVLLQHCPQWLSVVRELWHKVPHVHNHANEIGQLLLVHGGVISVIPCIFLGQGWMPSALYSTLKKDFWLLEFQLLAVQDKGFSWTMFSKFMRVASWSSSEVPYITMSL